jgi:membrane AbrB-like protein
MATDPNAPLRLALRGALALAIGTAGGAVFAWLQLPLPWMLGAMTAVTVAAMSGVRVSLPAALRSGCVTILGVMLGASFTPAIIARMTDWSVTIAALLVWCLLSGAAGWLYFRIRTGYDPVTAYFAASPGGLNEMTLVGSQLGGDDRTISLIHATRVFLTVFSIPFWFRFEGGLDAAATQRAYVGLLAVDPVDAALLVGCAVLGGFGAARLRVPAATVVGPMLLSAAVHLAGLTESAPPTLLVFAAQVVIGTALGCRFQGFALGAAGRTIGHGCAVGMLMIALTVAFSFGLERLTGLPLAAILLAFAPGGLAEMSLVALALAVDAAFVATHHIVRIILVVLFAPVLFRWLGRRS